MFTENKNWYFRPKTKPTFKLDRTRTQKQHIAEKKLIVHNAQFRGALSQPDRSNSSMRTRLPQTLPPRSNSGAWAMASGTSVCVTMSQCVWLWRLRLSTYSRWPPKVQLAPCRNRNCTECATSTLGRNRTFTESAHFSTFGAINRNRNRNSVDLHSELTVILYM